ncbi:hypothetical protein AVEN_209572-1, partial [Araneus ventricosus]
MQQPPVLPGTTRHRKWAQRATPPLLCHRIDESQVRPVIGSGPKEPHHHYCAIGLTRACLLIRQPLLRELTVSPRWGRAD